MYHPPKGFGEFGTRRRFHQLRKALSHIANPSWWSHSHCGSLQCPAVSIHKIGNELPFVGGTWSASLGGGTKLVTHILATFLEVLESFTKAYEMIFEILVTKCQEMNAFGPWNCPRQGPLLRAVEKKCYGGSVATACTVSPHPSDTLTGWAAAGWPCWAPLVAMWLSRGSWHSGWLHATGFKWDDNFLAQSRPCGRKTLVPAELLIRSTEKMMLSFITVSHLGKESLQF